MTNESEITDFQVIPDAPTLQRDPDMEIASATIAAKALKKVIDSNPNKVVIRGATFLRYEDWQTVGQFYGYSVQTDEAQPCEIEGVKGAKAKAILLDRQGNLVGGAEAYCMRDEEKWAGKPWFQLASMAQTRAGAKALRNRLAWVAVLAGFQPTPAEEMDGERGETHYEKRQCPECGSEMWDNRTNKLNPRAPDFKCKDKTCGKGMWEEDRPKESPEQVAIRELMAQAEKLLPPNSQKLAQLRGISDPNELGEKVQILLDLKKQKEAIPQEKAAKIAEVRASMAEFKIEERAYMDKYYQNSQLADLALDQLIELHESLVPF